MSQDKENSPAEAGKLGGGLAATLTLLREQLLLTQIGSIDQDLRFEMQEIEVELSLALTKDVGGKFGLKFWVVSADAEGKVESNATQKLKLKMRLVDTRPAPNLPVEKKTALVSGEDSRKQSRQKKP